MTALDDYAKLEAEGQYHDGQAPGARAVVVSFGERSLVISDFSDHVLAHWPLASLSIQGAGAVTAVLPDPSSTERVVLEDKEMVAAIRQVCSRETAETAPAMVKRGPRWRGWVLALAVLAGLVWFALSQTGRLAGLLPLDRVEALGKAMAVRIAGTAGPGGTASRTCAAQEGVAALDRLLARLLPAEPLPYALRVRVLDHPAVDGVALPGGHILLFRGVLDRAETPEEVAAVLAHLMGHVAQGDPARQAFAAAREQGVLGVAMGDILRDGVVVPASSAAMQPGHDIEAEAGADAIAHALLASAGLPSLAYANFINRVGSEGLALHPDPGGRARAAAEADQVGASAFAPALDDRNWIALQNICDP